MQTLSNRFTALMPLAKDLSVAAVIAACFSAFIYFEHFGLTYKALNSLLALGALYALLSVSRRIVVASGFFIGLFWFYWIGFSFQYYGLMWMVPLVSLGFGIVYMLYFGVLALSTMPWLRAILLFGLTYLVTPFGFDWMRAPLLFVESYFGTQWWQFALILFVLSIVASLKEKERFAAVLLLLLALNYDTPRQHEAPLKIKLVSTDTPQELKWRPRMVEIATESNLLEIDQAIEEGYDLVLLPESTFALYLNLDEELIKRLKRRSYRIAIVTGALLEENGLNYNVSYFFHEGEMQIAKKMVLVPFGEYIPLPEFARAFINDLFFNGASDYSSAEAPTDFRIKGVTFRNAICYEATSEALYEESPKYMLAISNNGWFVPSVEPTLQELLIRYYARNYGTVVYHTTNRSGSSIVE